MKTLKDYRSEMHYSQNQLAEITGVSIKNIRNFEQNPKSFEKARCINVLNIFNVLSVSVEEYFSYLNIKQEIEEKKKIWYAEHPLKTNYNIAKTRYYNLFYSKYRKNKITKIEYENIVLKWKELSNIYKTMVNDEGCLSNEYFIEYSDKMNKLMYQYFYENEKRDIDLCTKRIRKSMFIKGITNEMLSYLMDKNEYYLRNCETGIRKFSGMSVISGLKLCYALEHTFYDLFRDN